MVRKSLVLLIAVVALLSIGTLIVAAQDAQPTMPPTGQGMMGGMQSMGMNGMRGMGGRGMMMGMDDMPGVTAVAEALGMEPAALVEALQSGQTLAQIAEAQGVDIQTVTDAMLSTAQTHLADLVAAGTLTQAQADEHLAFMHDHMDDMPMFSGEGCAMMGAMHSMGMHDRGYMGGMHGMSGHPAGMGWNG